MQKFSESLSLISEDYLKENRKKTIFSPASEIIEEQSKNEFFKVKLSVETKYERKKPKEKINPFSFFTPKDEISPSEAEYPEKNYRKSLYPDPSLYISSHLSLARLQLFNLLYPSYSSSSFNPIKPDQILSNSPFLINPSTFRNLDITSLPRFSPYPPPPRSSQPPVVRPVPKRLIPLCSSRPDRLSQFTTTLTNPTIPRHLPYEKTSASRHLPDKDSTTPRHLPGHQSTTPRLLPVPESTTPRLLPNHEYTTSRHLPGHETTTPRHLPGNESTVNRHPAAAMNTLSLRPYLPPLPPPPGLHFIWEHSFLNQNQHKVNINLLCKHGIRKSLNI